MAQQQDVLAVFDGNLPIDTLLVVPRILAGVPNGRVIAGYIDTPAARSIAPTGLAIGGSFLLSNVFRKQSHGTLARHG